jgi:DNA-binding transcriptional ArsR family regulator
VATKRRSDGEHELYERQAVICKAFANSTRLQLVGMLLRGERWATELQAGLGISKANLSQHLSVLKSAGVVSTRREGKQLHCGIAVPEVKQAMGIFRSMLKAQGKESRRWS